MNQRTGLTRAGEKSLSIRLDICGKTSKKRSALASKLSCHGFGGVACAATQSLLDRSLTYSHARLLTHSLEISLTKIHIDKHKHTLMHTNTQQNIPKNKKQTSPRIHTSQAHTHTRTRAHRHTDISHLHTHVRLGTTHIHN